MNTYMDNDIEEWLLILRMYMSIQHAAAAADAAAFMHHQMLIASSMGPHLHRNTKRKRKTSKRVNTKEEGDYGSDANSNKCSINDVVCQVDEDEEDQVPKILDSIEKISKGYLENAAKARESRIRMEQARKARERELALLSVDTTLMNEQQRQYHTLEMDKVLQQMKCKLPHPENYLN